MKIRCVLCIPRWRHRCVLFAVSLLAVCLLQLVSVRLRLRDSIYIEPYGITVGLSRIHAHGFRLNCSAIYELDPVEVGRALEIKRKVMVDVDDDATISLTSDCPSFIRTRGYHQVPVREPERNFPLAYSLVVHKNAPMVERILHAIYAPHNIYCIHYDQKSSPAFRKAIRNLAGCLHNVFVASRLESVEYAHISRLKADLNCLSDLLGSEVQWKYVINLCGQDFPLRTNQQLVAELKGLNGSNMLESSRPSKLKKQRFLFQHQLKDVPYEYRRTPIRTGLAKAPPPHGIQVFIGSAYFVLSRDFVAQVNGSELFRDFLAWSEDTYSPDEHFWASLVRVPGLPGHIPRSHADISDLSSKTRLVKWSYLEGTLYPACTGTHQRSVCIYGAAELRWLLRSGHWFANKFDPKVDPVLITCLEEKLTEQRGQLNTANS